MSNCLTGDVLQTSLVQMQQQQFKQQFNKQQQQTNKKRRQLYQVWTSLHNYPLEGPYYMTELNNQVWYCDNKNCRHTTHGVYKKYKIPAWRSVQLGKGYVLCDGCVKAYPRQQYQPQKQPQQQQQHQRQYSQQQYQQPQYPQPNQYIQTQNSLRQPLQQQQQQQHQRQFSQQLQPQYQQIQYQQPQYQQQYQQQQQQQPYQYHLNYKPQNITNNNTSFTQQDFNLIKSQPEGGNSNKINYNNNINNNNKFNNQNQSTPYAPNQTIISQQSIRSTPLGPNNNNNNQIQYVNYNNNNVNNNKTKNNNSNNKKNTSSLQTIKEGWMMKQGDFMKNWKRRYFYFYSNGNLIYFENNKTQKEKGRVNFSLDATGIKKKKEQGFIVITKKRKWQFVCKTQQIRDEWIKQIAIVCRVPVLD